MKRKSIGLALMGAISLAGCMPERIEVRQVYVLETYECDTHWEYHSGFEKVMQCSLVKKGKGAHDGQGH